MNFAEALTNEASKTYTQNGALARNTTFDACLDFFGTIGGLRDADDSRLFALFEEAYAEDPLFTMKILFYARDIRAGLGERDIFRRLINYIADKYPEAMIENIWLIGEIFGRWDDLYALLGTKLEDAMWEVMKERFEDDCVGYKEGKPISLLAKWIKTADASSKTTRTLGIITALKLGFPVHVFKRLVRDLRKYLKVVEVDMSTNHWDEINYQAVPSRAMSLYCDAFHRHDNERFNNFLNDVSKGKAKINASTLYPYDIVEKFLYNRCRQLTPEFIQTLESQWKALPNYVDDTNVLVIADVSGSMWGRPMAVSVGLAIYFAERNTGAYHNKFMTFSNCPQICQLKGNTLQQKIDNISKAEWGMNTNLKAAFDKILAIAIENDVPIKDMPKAICVISDMEIDFCGDKDWSFYDTIKKQFEEHGYEIPNIIFWNVNSMSNVFHADGKRKGVQLASGSSPIVFKQVIDNLGLTPIESMQNIINSERYKCVRIAGTPFEA